MRKRILICLMVIATAVAFMPTSTFAATNKAKMTSYTVYKTGDTVYCAGDSGIYRVKIKNGKVKSKKKLVTTGPHSYVYNLKKKGNYLYYMRYTEGTPAYICRVKTSGGKAKVLARLEEAGDFAIKNNKIYYSYYDWNYKTNKEIVVKKVMNLNGKNKKKTKVQAVEKCKSTNANAYKLKSNVKNKYARDYLKTPKGTFYLGKTKKYSW